MSSRYMNYLRRNAMPVMVVMGIVCMITFVVGTALIDLANSARRSVSEEDRILLMLKEVEGLSLKELEKVYNVNENALKVRLFRARQRVLKAFGASEKKEGSG